MDMISKEQAENLAVAYAAYTRTEASDYLGLSVWGQMLLAAIEDTGVNLHSPELIKARVARANEMLDRRVEAVCA